MNIIAILIFLLGYIAIAFEQKIKIDKAASALISGVLCWVVYFISTSSIPDSEKILIYQLGEISSILFFVLGALSIVGLIDSHQGFDIITEAIQTKSKSTLLIWIVIITFFLSSILDNLTTAIVMASLCKKLIIDKSDRLWFLSMVIIAANAGGAWSPLGDVTTTMLWIGGQISAYHIIITTFLPSLVVVVVPLFILTGKFKGQKIRTFAREKVYPTPQGKIILIAGLGLLIFVPVFKALTHLPAYMGMLFALGIIWIMSSLIHLDKQPDERFKFSVSQVLRKIDTSSILFFLGILLAVSALQTFGLLKQLAEFTVTYIKSPYLTGTILGIFSAIIDNVPLVAASQGMFDLHLYPTDHTFWAFLSLATGTGGSTLIIGSAAGVALMGIEQIDFLWYMKNISWLAILGFLAGLSAYIFQLWVLGSL